MTRWIVPLVVLFSLWTAPGWATTKYVDATPGGDCTANYNPTTRACDGSGAFASWNTIEEGITNIGASNTLIIRAGTYTGGGQVQVPTGTASAMTTIMNQPGEVYKWTKTSGSQSSLIYNTGGKSNWQLLCDVRGNCELDGNLHAESVVAAIIASFGGGSNVKIQNMWIHNSVNSGIGSWDNPSGWQYIGNLIHNTGSSNVAPHRGHSIYNDGDNNLVERNTLHTSYGIGVHLYNAAGNSDNNIVRYNLVYNGGLNATGVLSEITIDGTNNLVYRNSVKCGPLGTASVTNAFHRGIALYNLEGGADGNFVYHNSVTRCGTGISMDGTGSNTNNNNVILNNIAYNNTGNTAFTTTGTGNTTSNNTTANPLWADADNGNFSLGAGSVAIAAGTAIAGFSCNGTCDTGSFETFGFSSATANGNFVDVTLLLSLDTPVIPVITGWSFLVNGVARTTTNVSRLAGADSVVRVGFDGAACIAGQTLTITATAASATNSAFMGGITTANQPITAFTGSAVTNGCGTAVPTPPGTPDISYLLDDNTGTNAADAEPVTAGDQPGTLTGGPTWVTGKHLYGVNFANDTTDRYIAIPYGSGVNPSTQSLTVCLAALPDSGTESSQKVVFSTTNGTNQRFYIGRYGGKWGIGIQASGMDVGADLAVVSTWTRLCLVANSTGDVATLYVNGVASTAKAYTSFTLAANMRLGNDGTFTVNYGGTSVDDVKIYTSALSASEILEDFANWEPAPPPPTGTFVQAAHQFDDVLISAGHLGAVNASVTLRANTGFSLVTQTDCDNTANCVAIGQRLHVSRNGGAFAPVQDLCLSDTICFYGASSDPLLFSGASVCCLSGVLTPTNGLTLFDMSAVPLFDLPQDGSITQRYMLKSGNAMVENDTFDFKLIEQGGAPFAPDPPTNQARVTITPVTAISAPTNLHEVGAASNTIIEVIWAPVTSVSLAGYHVYQGAAPGGPYTLVATITSASAAATHSSMTIFRTVVAAAGTYYYVVRSFDNLGVESAASSEVAVVRTGPVARTPVVR